MIQCVCMFLGADGTEQSAVSVRISRPDFLTAVSPSAVDSIILTVVMSPEYPRSVPAVSVSGDLLHRRVAAPLSAALAEKAQQLTGQPMILDKSFTLITLPW